MRPAKNEDDKSKFSDMMSGPGGNLVRQCDVKGVLHAHSVYCEGHHSLPDMVRTAMQIGLEYLGVSDHFRSANHPCGLGADGFARQREEIEKLRLEFPDFDLFQGVEVEADAEGNLICPESLLADFDYVIVSLTDNALDDGTQQTKRAVRALMDPNVTILSKPAGAFILNPPPWPLDMEMLLVAAGDAGVAVELDANPSSPRLDWSLCQRAQELGVMISINPNAHRAARLVDYRHGVELARRAGVHCRNILNTMTSEDLRSYLAG